MHYIVVNETDNFDWEIIKREINDVSLNEKKNINFVTYDDNLLTNISQQLLFDIPEVTVIKDASCFSSEEKIKQNQELLSWIAHDDAMIYVFVTNKKVSKAFKQTNFKEITIEPLTKKNKKKYIDELLKQNNLKLSPQLYDVLIERLNEDYLVINNEINKIKLLQLENQPDAIIMDAICNYNEQNIFHLLESIMTKNTSKLMEIYEDIKLKKQDEIAVINIIASQINQLLMFKKLKQQGYDNNKIATLLGVAPFVIMNLNKLTTNTNLADIQKIMDAFYQLELDIKNMKVDKVLGFKNFLLNL